MSNLAALPNNLDPKGLTCRAVIETPKGRRSKYDYDPKARAFRLHSLLPDGMSFPLDFGFIPSTLCEDGDPMDVMVLSDEASEMGALLEVRLIGVMEAEESEKGNSSERNDRVLAVNCVSNLYEKVRTVDDLESTFIDNLSQFWIQKHALEGKRFKVLGIRAPAEAAKLIRKAGKAAKKH